MTSTENSANEAPGVSIICRTIGRDELQQTLQSIALQTYPNIEIVLVNASATELDGYQSAAGNTPLRLVSSGKPLKRSAAANAGLQAATGQYLMFLDDDDWIGPSHVKTLLEFLEGQDEIRAAYSSTQRADSQGGLISEFFDIDFDPLLLMRDNYIPIHSMLFSRSLLEDGCSFDESFDIYEDWDFWLQLNQFTKFQHINEITAYYREGGDFDTTVENEEIRYQTDHSLGKGRAAVFDKWLSRWSGDRLNQLFGQLDQSHRVNELETLLHRSNIEAHQQSERSIRLQQEVEELKLQLNTVKQHLLHTQTDYSRLLISHRELDRGFNEILNSSSWKITEPYRYIGFRLQKHVFGRLTGSNSNTQANTDTAESSMEIESPAENSDPVIDNLNVRGWAFSPAGLKEMTLTIDGVVHELPPQANICLDLLNECQSEEEAAQIGFNFKLALSGINPGEHVLNIQIETGTSQTLEQSRPFIFLDGSVIYQDWTTHCIPSKEIRHAQSIESENLKQATVIQLIISPNGCSTSNGDKLLNTIKSLLKQTYSHWRCNLVDAENSSALQKIQELDPKRIHYSDDLSQTISKALTAPGYTAFMEFGEILSDSSLWDFIAEKQDQAEFVYSDHDTVEVDGNRSNPVFTFGWSPDHLQSNNYIGGIYFVANTFLRTNWPKLPVDESFFENLAWRYELLLHLTNLSKANQRIAKVLWSKPVASIDAESAIFEDESQRLKDYLQANDLETTLACVPESRTRHVIWNLETSELVSIIIPTTGNLNVIKPCIDSIRNKTDYSNFEIIVLDNGRGEHREGIDYISGLEDVVVQVIECNEAFNWSRLNNLGVKHSKGELLLFLNDDVEVIDSDWLTELVRQASRDDVGVVGSLLLYPNGAIQHAGVFLVDHGGGARHLFHKIVPDSGNYQNLDLVVRETSAVTGACLMITREKFTTLGEFDETLPVAGNDIDLCLRALESGYRNIWTPYSKLIHHESVSRKNAPIDNDERRMWKAWGEYFREGDRYYNPNLSLQREDCALREDTIPAKNLPNSAAVTNSRKYSSEKLDFGVNLIAYIRAEMGVGEAARGNANALDTAGIPFVILNLEEGNPSKMDNLRWHHKETLLPEYDINLIHINADHLPKAMENLGSESVENRYNIAYWAWELPEFPDKWLSSYQHLDEIWVPSVFVNDAISMKSPIPVITIPHAVELNSKFLLSKKDLALPEDRFLFLSMFDTHSVSERKNPFGAITAFMHAFEKDDASAALVIKVNNADQRTLDELNKKIADYSNIVILDRHLDRDGIDSLLANIDCFLSLHRSEGFGLGPAEAMSLGKVALLTDWSGNTQYMTEDNCLRVKYQLQELEEDFGPYQAGQFWAQPDYDHAAILMQKIVSDPELARKIGENAKRTIETEFSPQAIGSLMRNRLSSIQKILSARSTHS